MTPISDFGSGIIQLERSGDRCRQHGITYSGWVQNDYISETEHYWLGFTGLSGNMNYHR